MKAAFAGAGPCILPEVLRCAAWAAVALALFLGWQFLTVHYNRGGNWSALFLVGSGDPMPAELERGTYRFPGSGYDGEMYRLVAHDPFFERGYERYLDNPAQRYVRILVPALAYLLAAGDQRRIDAGYIAVVALFAFLGSLWMTRWAAIAGVHPAWGLVFLLVPATLISMDRMTVDIALAALTAGFALYHQTGAWLKLFLVLALACLARETGVLLVAGACLFELWHRRPGRAMLWACSALPLLAWYWIVLRRFPAKGLIAPVGVLQAIGRGLFYYLLHPPRYPLAPLLETIARFADVLALVATLAGCVLAVLALRAAAVDPMNIAGVLFAILILVMPGAVWRDVNGYSRVLSPMLILIALPAAALPATKTRGYPGWFALAPLLMIDLRLSLQFAAAIGGVIKGLISF